MLIGLDPLLTPDLLHALAAMGHGDTIALVDANYPATRGRRLIPLAGVGTAQALAAVLTVLPVEAAVTMQVIGDAASVPAAVAEMAALLVARGGPAPGSLERHAFYAAAGSAYAIVATGERRRYGNILLTKGVVRLADAGGGA